MRSPTLQDQIIFLPMDLSATLLACPKSLPLQAPERASVHKRGWMISYFITTFSNLPIRKSRDMVTTNKMSPAPGVNTSCLKILIKHRDSLLKHEGEHDSWLSFHAKMDQNGTRIFGIQVTLFLCLGTFEVQHRSKIKQRSHPDNTLDI